MPAPHGALPTSSRAQKCGMVMSVTTQIIFPYMSDARAPAMDIRMTPQDTATALSFRQNLSAILIGDNGSKESKSPKKILERKLWTNFFFAFVPYKQ